MKDRVNKRTKMNLEAEDRRLAHIKQHVAKLKAEHEGRNDFDFGTKGTVGPAWYSPCRGTVRQSPALISCF